MHIEHDTHILLTLNPLRLKLCRRKYRNVVYFSNSYNLEVRKQSEDRAHRIGQKHKVTYIDIQVPSSIDTMIISALKRKIQLSAATLGEEAKKWL